jgi:hypothetical protein
MSVNDTQPDGEKLGKDFFINVMGDFLQLLRYHTRNPVVFLGFGARMGDHAINDGRILALDALRQKNPFLMKDDIYVADITSCSKEVATGPAWPQWELSRLQLLRNLAMAIHQERDSPFTAPSPPPKKEPKGPPPRFGGSRKFYPNQPKGGGFGGNFGGNGQKWQ